ncbi:hypothetical protein EJB05_33466, partial [Eragrostis curvula]
MAALARSSTLIALAAVVLAVLGGAAEAKAKLSPNFYSRSCPNLATIVRQRMSAAIQQEKRMGASILRLFFHDCFVNFNADFVTAMIKMGNLRPAAGMPTEVRLNCRVPN